MKSKLLFFFTLCFAMGSFSANAQDLSTVTAATPKAYRTATSVDLVWTATTGATSYNVIDATNSNIIVSGITGLSVSVTGLAPVTSYSYQIVAINSTSQSLPSAAVSITTRQAGTNYQIIEDFEGTTSSYWTTQNRYAASVTAPSSNSVTNGIDPSANCALFTITNLTNARSYTGISANNERIDIGPDAPYQYLHVKMRRDPNTAGDGGFGCTLYARTDITQAQVGLTTIPYASTMVDGNWYDYVFDLKNVSKVTTDLTYYGFYFQLNVTSGNPLAVYTSYIDDVYLSNDATPLDSNMIPTVVTAISSDVNKGSVTGGGTYLKGTAVTLTATPLAGNQFVQWSDGTNTYTTNPLTYTPTGNVTLTATFGVATAINEQQVDSKWITVAGRNLIFQGTGVVTIYNELGQLLLTRNVSDSSITLNAGGIYLVRFTTSQGVKIKKVVVY